LLPRPFVVWCNLFYSLRSLMIGLTLFCVLLGGRIEYLRRMAVFHEQEAHRCAMEVKERTGWYPLEPRFVPFRVPRGVGLALVHAHAHRELAIEYRNAVLHPWLTIKSPMPPASEERLAKLVEW